jgi:predicted nucleic acid-binding protein
LKVICDSTVIIGLAKIGKLDLLKQIYGEVCIPEAVFIEVAVEGR